MALPVLKAHLAHQAQVTDDPEYLAQSDRVVQDRHLSGRASPPSDGCYHGLLVTQISPS
jgi:hypothetical protein